MSDEFDKQQHEEDQEEVVHEVEEIWLPDGQIIAVDADHYPILKEWDWKFDPGLAQVVRADSPAVTLYDEQVKWHVHRKMEDETLPVLTREPLRKLFGHQPAFRAATILIQQQRAWAYDELDVSVPTLLDLLAEGLAIILASYFREKAGKEEWVFVEDPDGLTPGRLERQSMERRYSTLGEWMDTDLTGEWVRDRTAPTGLVPERQRRAVRRRLHKLWREFVKEDNPTGPSPRTVEQELREVERPVLPVLDHLVALLATYPLP